MPTYGRKSRAILSTLCEDLQDILSILIKYVDIALIDGARNQKRQEIAYSSKPPLSNAKFGQSPHNWNCSCCVKSKLPRAMAVDIVPYPVPPWNDKNPLAVAETERRFNEALLIAQAISDAMGVPITLGKNFSSKDLPHIEKTNWPAYKSSLILADWTDIF